MFRLMKRMCLLVLCLGLVAGTASCSKKAAETPAVPTAPVTVTGLDLGRSVGSDKRVPEKTNEFHPNDVIYASVLTSGSATNAILKARWTYQDGQLVDESEQAIAPTGDAASEFHISKPGGWPVGKYKVDVYLNGTPAQSKEFEVK